MNRETLGGVRGCAVLWTRSQRPHARAATSPGLGPAGRM